MTEILDEKGNLMASYEYDPYGRTIIESGSCALANPLGFSSEITDRETGTMYYNYRDYNPTDGRWLTRDTIGEISGYNLYRFVKNRININLDFIGLEEDSRGTDYDAAAPRPGSKKCIGFFEIEYPSMVGDLTQEQLDQLDAEIKRINNIVDKKSRKCYIVFLRREPINTESIKDLPWLADRAFLMAHTGKCSNGDILVNSGGKVIRVPNREPIVYIIGCHRATEVNGGKTIPISGAMQMLINKLKEIKGKDYCPCEEKILITGGSKDSGYY
ncbi:RHS repeat-associated core domain-containing protein [Akkermansia sp. N21116]|uniref:RHS repeat domain-containing protein n=1 Tax=Akkermansia sp. N21116 TaxID=3040764 RepID=UPI00244E93A2|nr:RHS repeat-associated core domain-containing protein [Akkermansia sp. N21116]WPX40801.1 RHS repeat-associated core domain-containing protein [Akkermansia sp. N21116]